MEVVIVFISLFATIFGISYYHLFTRNKERLALIEAGADASLFQAPRTARRIHPAYSIVLVLGMLIVGVGLGMLTGALLDSALDFINNTILYFSGTMIFGGIGLLASFFLLRKIDHKDRVSDV
jgi:hypothetical protein